MADAHTIAERANVLAHELYARRVDADPTLLRSARRVVDAETAANGGTNGEKLWKLILERPWEQVRTRMLADNSEGRLLRSNSPFALVIGITDQNARRQLWRQAKHGLSTART